MPKWFSFYLPDGAVSSAAVNRDSDKTKSWRRATAYALSLAVCASSFVAPVRAQDNYKLSDPIEPATESLLTTETAAFVPGEVVVRFRNERTATHFALSTKSFNSSDLTANQHSSLNGAAVERSVTADVVEGVRVLKVAPTKSATLRAIAELQKRADVLYAEPNYIWTAQAIPNDPSFNLQWNLKNTGQSGGTPGADINAEAAWNFTQGSREVVVAILDEGIDVQHPDLQENVWQNPGEIPNNGIDDDGNGRVDDVNGWDFINGNSTIYDGNSTEGMDRHGTHVAGIVGAKGNNGMGVTGVNWNVSLMSLKVLGANGGNSRVTSDGIAYATMMRRLWNESGGTRGANVRVINASLGGRGYSITAFNAISAASQQGILFVAAAGNDATDNDIFGSYPANYDLPNVIAVANTTRNDGLSASSQFGARTVSMGAPGSGIYSTYPRSSGSYAYLSGTSMASPQVAGAAALLWALRPDVSLEHLRGALLYSGDLIPALDGKTSTGRRLDIFNSIQSVMENDFTAPAPISDLQLTGIDGRRLQLEWTAPGDDGTSGQVADYDAVFNDPVEGKTILTISLQPVPAGTRQRAVVNVPFLRYNGTIDLIAYDNVGNKSVTPFNYSVSATSNANPYLLTTEANQALSGGGTALDLRGDDRYLADYALPFAFPFFEKSYTKLTVSTNGALYFSRPLYRRTSPENADDAGSAVADMQMQAMIAGLWTDIRTDNTGGNIFVVRPDADTIIFRWQAVTYTEVADNGRPVNFEIELRRNGAIRYRYGAGNQGINPVVGIGAGEPSAYVVGSHTSEYGGATISLGGASTVVFTPRAINTNGTRTKRRLSPVRRRTAR